jgi:hypothetical protein
LKNKIVFFDFFNIIPARRFLSPGFSGGDFALEKSAAVSGVRKIRQYGVNKHRFYRRIR